MGETPILTARLHSNWSHRMFSYALMGVVLIGAARARMDGRASSQLRRLSAISAAAITLELILGAALVSSEFGLALRVMHGVIGAAALASLAAWAAADARVRSASRVL